MSNRRPWTDADTRTLRRLAERGLSLREIGERMGRNARHINQRASCGGIDVRRVIGQVVRWTSQADAQLHRLYASHSCEEIAAQLGVSVSAVYNRAHHVGLYKSREWVAARARDRWAEGRHEGSRAGHFPKGNVPANKGQRRPGWAPGRMAETQFKKGRPATATSNYLPIGSVRVTRDGYLERKMTDDPRIVPARRWTAVSRLVWEAAHGPIPRAHLVAFKPGMHTVVLAEITLDRLECITKAENMKRNTCHNYPKPIAELIQLRGALTRKINRLTRSPHEKQD